MPLAFAGGIFLRRQEMADRIRRLFKERGELIRLIAVIFFSVALIAFTCYHAFSQNPDGDAYFLIETGRYIAVNHKLPDTAYWLITDGVPTMTQQWLCCIVNYAFYSLFGLTGTKYLALILAGVLYGIDYLFAKSITVRKSDAMGLAAIMLFMTKAFISTRPYTMTIAASVLMVYVLRRFFSEKEHTPKSITLFYVATALIFVFQANWQISNTFFPMLWICCFIPRLKDKKPSLDLYAIGALGVGIVSTVLNPNGLKGALYIVNTIGDVKGFKIAEMMSPPMKSVKMVFAVIVIALTVYLIKQIPLWLLFASAGSVLASCVYIRCSWMMAIPLACLIVMLKADWVKTLIRTAVFFAFVIYGFIKIPDAMVYYFWLPNEVTEQITSYIPNNEDTVLFTDFNTGNFMMFSGYKIYYDARPDIYGPGIAGSKALNSEMLDVMEGRADYDEFVDKYGFNWFVVSSTDDIKYYLDYNEDRYEIAYEGYGPTVYHKIG